MLQMMQARKAELEKRGTKGFTMMEMLIVVAMIAILVAIAIPVFTTQLDAVKMRADEANARSLWAVEMVTYMTNDGMTNDDLPQGLPLTSAGTINYDGTDYAFSDKTTELINQLDADGKPVIQLTSNGQVFSFPQ